MIQTDVQTVGIIITSGMWRNRWQSLAPLHIIQRKSAKCASTSTDLGLLFF